jgi:hypothetical protein
MKESKENEIKSIVHVTKDVTLLFIAFTIFTFIATISPDMLKNHILLSLQLVLSIPLFMSALLSRSRLGTSVNAQILDRFGSITFLIAYAFLINVVGIILDLIVTVAVSEVFFAANVLMVIIYSAVKGIHDKRERNFQISQDVVFLIFIILFGLLPVIKFY